MNSIVEIINSFNKNDIHVLEKYIQIISKSDKKQLLFKLIRKNRNIDKILTSSVPESGVHSGNIRKLKERLQKDVEDVIFLRMTKNNPENKYYQNYMNAVSSLVLVQYYMQQGLLNEAYKKLKKAHKMIRESNLVFLEFNFYQLQYEYLQRTGGDGIEHNIEKSLTVLSELRLIQQLKLDNLNINSIHKVDEEWLINRKNKSDGFFTNYFSKLLLLKHYLLVGETVKGNLICDELVENYHQNPDKIPPGIYIETLLQKLKINILNDRLDSNLVLISDIKKIKIDSEFQLLEFLQLRFINRFLAGDYSICRNIMFYLSTNERLSRAISEEVKNQWEYFTICVEFVNGRLGNVLKLISQLPGQSSISDNVCINVRIVEIYSLILLGKDELLSGKLVSVKNLIKRLELNRYDRYKYLIDRLTAMINKSGGIAENLLASPSEIVRSSIPVQDVLGLELISINLFEELCNKKNINFQYAY